MDRALLDLHRMRVHAFPSVAVKSDIFFSDGDWATGLIDALQVSAARCPHDGDTISSTHQRLTSEMCPVCFLDGALVPSERVKEYRGDLARHFFRTHVPKKKQGYTDADAVLQRAFANLDRAPAPVFRGAPHHAPRPQQQRVGASQDGWQG